MDHLSPFFDHFSPSAKVIFNGNLCFTSRFDEPDGLGHLHVLYAGSLEVSTNNGERMLIDEPSLLLYPRQIGHQLQPVDGTGADMVCASIDLGSGLNNPLVTALPEMLQVKLSEIPQLLPTLNLLVEESTHTGSGQRAALDRLTEYLLILLLRHVVESGRITAGIIAGLGDVRLQKAIKAMHERPGHQWTLEELADLSAMSRARFATRFRETTGTTPLNHLTLWRMGVASSMLKKGGRIERISQQVGYNSQSAFTRVFTKHVGLSPLQWLEAQNSDAQ